jgi:hypothetical protein
LSAADAIEQGKQQPPPQHEHAALDNAPGPERAASAAELVARRAAVRVGRTPCCRSVTGAGAGKGSCVTVPGRLLVVQLSSPSAHAETLGFRAKRHCRHSAYGGNPAAWRAPSGSAKDWTWAGVLERQSASFPVHRSRRRDVVLRQLTDSEPGA